MGAYRTLSQAWQPVSLSHFDLLGIGGCHTRFGCDQPFFEMFVSIPATVRSSRGHCDGCSCRLPSGRGCVMLPFYLFAILALLGISSTLPGEASADDDDTMDDPESDDPTILVNSGVSYQGTDSDETYGPAQNASDYDGVRIDAGGGDDILDFLLDPDQDSPPADTVGLISAELYGGDGDDRIEAVASRSTIDGGVGDDDITVLDAYGTHIFGGDGDDEITGNALSGDILRIDGGAGNDVIDIRDAGNVVALGGEGDDTLLFGQPIQGGAGHVVETYGGEGNDTLIYDGSPGDGEAFIAPTVYGGAGDDTFVVIVDESLPVYVPPEDETAPLELVVIADFVPGSELLIVDSQPEDPEFSLVGATLEEAEGSTTLTLHYEHPDEDDINRVIVIEATGVAWSDIVFEGEDLPVIVWMPVWVTKLSPWHWKSNQGRKKALEVP